MTRFKPEDIRANSECLSNPVENALALDRNFNKFIGFDFISAAEGVAKFGLSVEDRHVNSHGFCHGGILFALADTSLAYANMSLGKLGVTLSANAIFLKSVKKGDYVIATSKLIQDGKRAFACEVSIKNQSNDQVVSFQGNGLRF